MKGFFKSIGLKLIEFADSGWAKLAAITFVTVAGVTAKIYNDLASRGGLPVLLQDAYREYPLILTFADWVPIPALAITLFLSWLKQKLTANQPAALTLLGLLDCIAMAVGKKIEARHHKACLVVGQKPSSNQPIHASTPVEQIKVLIDGVHKVFQREATNAGMPPEIQVKVTLAEMNATRDFERLWYYFPANLGPTSPDKFKRGRSFFNVVAEKCDMLILKNIPNELKRTDGEARYLASQADGKDTGSIIAFPIRISPIKGYPEVPLVLAIKCDTENIFTDARSGLYRLLLTPFVERIKLEFYNHIISRNEEYYGDHPVTTGKDVRGAAKGSGRAKTKNRTAAQNPESD